MKRAVLYLRVSTQDQDLENQRIRLTDYCKFKEWEIVDEFTDKISGLKDRRPGLNNLLTRARKRDFDVVVAVKLDRLGRSTQHLLQLVEEFHHYNIDIAFTDQPIDTTTSMGRFTFQILSAVAEFERELIKERTKQGIDKARRKGVKLGRPKVAIPFDKKLEIISLRRNNKSLRKISTDMGISIRQVRYVIMNSMN